MTTTLAAEAWMTLDWLRSIPAVSIPDYQRSYRWDEASCERLLDDILALSPEGTGINHFIGSILVRVVVSVSELARFGCDAVMNVSTGGMSPSEISRDAALVAD